MSLLVLPYRDDVLSHATWFWVSLELETDVRFQKNIRLK